MKSDNLINEVMSLESLLVGAEYKFEKVELEKSAGGQQLQATLT